MEAALLLVLILGVNLTLWLLVGGVRFASERLAPKAGDNDRASNTVGMPAPFDPADVAVLIPAHNEEPVIAATISSAVRLVPESNVHVIADGCTDATAD